MQSQKRQNDLCFQGKAFNITVIQVYAPTTIAKETEVVQFYEDLEDLELTPKNRCSSHHWGLECKSRSQEIRGETGKFGLREQNAAEG